MSRKNLLPNIILEIDGQLATELTLTRLDEMFERPLAYKLAVRRGGQTLQVTLKRRRLV